MTQYYVGYGTQNKGVISTEKQWKVLNKGKKPTKAQMKMLQIEKMPKNFVYYKPSEKMA